MQFLLLVCLTLELPGFFMPRITMVFYNSVFQPVCRGTQVYREIVSSVPQKIANFYMVI